MNIFRDLLNIFKHYRLSTLLNISGMTLAISVSYIMLSQVYYNYTYNAGVKDSHRLFRVENRIIYRDKSEKFMAQIATPCARLMVANNPVVEGFHFGALYGREVDHTFEKFPDEPLVFSGTELSESSLVALGVTLVEGSFEPVLKRSAMAFSRSVADKYGLSIGDKVCWGREWNIATALTVGAIFEDFPRNSDLYGLQAFYGPYHDKMESNDWSNWNETLYVRLYDENDTEAFMQYVLSQFQLIDEPRIAGIETIDELKKFLRLTPFDKVHFTTDVYNGNYMVNKAILFTLLAIAVIVMIIAYVNFFNFFVALIPERIRSINTRKILGASAFSLRMGIFVETLFLMFLSFLFSLLLLYLIDNKTVHEIFLLEIPLFSYENIPVAALLVTVTLITTLIIAIYPAYYITSFQPAFVLKSNFGATSAGKILRNTLIGVQFVLSFIFIIVTFFMFMQISFMTKHDKGFDSKNVIQCSQNQLVGDCSNTETLDLLYAELLASPYITDVSISESFLVGDYKSGWGRIWSQNTENPELRFRVLPVSWNFLKTLGIKVVEGRDFTAYDCYSKGGKFIFNMNAKKKYDMTLDDWVSENGEHCEIVGFCKDFNERSMQYPIEPFAFYVSSNLKLNTWSKIYIKLYDDADYNLVNEHLKSVSEKFGGDLHKYTGFNRMIILDEFLSEAGYREERAQLLIIMIISFVAIAISLFGVFGLVFFETQYRQREIALRRINGALVGDILRLFNIRFIKILLFCFVIVLPIATYLVQNWLQQFAYTTPLYWWIYAAAFAIVAILTLAIVLLSAWKTVNKNPIEVLR